MKKIIIISGPSGVGKSTCIKKILKENNKVNFITPFTTRPKRVEEIDSQDYYFIDRKTFTDSYKEKLILDWDYTLNNYYGFFKSDFENINEISITHALAKMALRIKYSYPDKYITIFLEPSDDIDIKSRIEKRDTCSDDLAERINHGTNELAHKDLFDHILKSDNTDFLFSKITLIINNES